MVESLRAPATRARHAPAPCNPRGPGARGRPLPTEDQERVRRLAWRGPGGLVAAVADATPHVGLAGLVALRCQAEVCADVARAAEPIGPVRGVADSECGQRADAWHAR